jgi:hypothetical protein
MEEICGQVRERAIKDILFTVAEIYQNLSFWK